MIFIASDHGGYELKEKIRHNLATRSVAFEDFGCFGTEPVDYPGYTHRVAKAVKKYDGRGILFCRTGQGMAITANRHRGIRAAICWSPEIASHARAHNDANILVLPADQLDDERAWDIITVFMATPFSKEARHIRRIKQIDEG